MKISAKRITFYLLLIAVAVVIFLTGQSKDSLRTLTTADYLDTVCDITVVSSSDKLLNMCDEYLKFAHSEFNKSDENSALYKYNHGASSMLSLDFTELLAFGEDFSQKHPEYFSIYLEPVIRKWNFDVNTAVPDVSAAMKEAESHISVDFGAIAKGFISDKLAEKLKSAGAKSALINLGGNAYALGKKPTGEAWKIGIQDPQDANSIIGTISAENIAVITSGDYQRFFEVNGKRYHHILNPKTGFPAESGVHSVSVIHESATLADALSTAAFVAGIEDGNKLLKSYGALGIFVTDDTVYFSKELENIFKQSDFSYKYEFLY